MPVIQPVDSNAQSKAGLRRKLRAARRALTAAQRLRAAEHIAAKIIQSPDFDQATHVAAYMATASEISVLAVMQAAHAGGKSVWLPVINGQRMGFAAWTPELPMRSGELGICEPAPPHVLQAPQQLDLVLTPLLGYTTNGDRLGQGGGFYDRTFAFRDGRKRPVLLGIAHACQRLASLPVDDWDVPLDGVVTNEQWLINLRRTDGVLADQE